jgi:hypothetical protein
VGDGDQPGRGDEQPLEVGEVEVAGVGDRRRDHRAPASSATICQGTMLEWCSSSVTRISSPGRQARPEEARATRLIASVAPRTKTISSAEAAPRKRGRAASRAPS